MNDENQHQNSYRIGITQGDYNGIGYEIILKTFLDPRLLELLTPVLYGQSKLLSYYKKNFGLDNFAYSLSRDVRLAWQKKFNIINISDDDFKIDPGVSSPLAGQMAVRALRMAVDDLNNGYIDALVTAPVNPKNMSSGSFQFSGQMEYLSSFFKCDTMMLFVDDVLKIGMVTSCLPFSQVLENISTNLILSKLKVLAKCLNDDFRKNMPKIAVLGLNPSSCDESSFGTEEASFIIPAISEANSCGILAFGPFSADMLFGSGAWRKYDAVLAMYHDQAMIPFKLLSADAGVCFTAGLPVVRTSPVHGVSYDIANKNVASPDAFRHALFLALDIVKNRQCKEEPPKIQRK